MKTGARPYAIDANVILRYILRDSEELSPKARTIMAAAKDGQIVLSCDPIILAEVVWVLTSYYELSKAQICEALDPILKSDGVVVENKSRYLRAMEIYATTPAHFADACACAAALEECEGRLLSFDRKLSSVTGIMRTESVDR